MIKKLDLIFQNMRKAKNELHLQLYLFEKDRLYLNLGFSSLYDFLIHHARCSEGEAYELNTITKMMSINPQVATSLETGSLSFATLKAIRPMTDQALTYEDKSRMLATALNCQPQQAVEKIQNEFPMVKIDHFYKRMTLFFDQEMDELFSRIKNQLSHRYPRGVRLNNAITDSWKFYLSQKKYDTKEREGSLASLKRMVWTRAKAQCEFVSHEGRRCTSKYLLQIDHVIPKSKGGQDTPSNLRLLCANHNKHESMLRMKSI
ncbi:MAG: hypothetical protein COW00_19515 [Bdellovibrio sp. CG12_big_fil_rev_8_21_14_0_65_39_13]|nr:MAG: hypothetical protein COW78_03745 [Bdellovibrio sp. CG22_combo_CG10-13_8_21_14_all_39_27]PIQ57677.1 MAG: hypothetical protein COW00_19515 [Bdellovibrio sp. CG12_big_fil_rev_8_21_14_0_65_39_13]PIR35189.1 MAG: hypothetical protein COV37_09770 [Bdellovibrio sp. CG11_big_fil_rev_8_21_14_0_20_39_38]